MVESRVVFSESQALKRLAEEQWTRQGDSLVSQHAFTPDAVNQYQEPLSERTRNTIGFSTQASDLGGAASNAQKLVLNANAAERFFPKGTLNLIEELPGRGSRPR